MSLRLTAILGACAVVLASSSGCSTLNQKTPKAKDSWSISKLWKKEYQQPQSIAVIWAPDVLTVPGKPTTRGFGGRFYFYNELSQAIPVDGELMVHGYLKQTQSDQSEQVAADKTFGFTAEQLVGHFSPSEMGASYSVWIPWDAAENGPRQEITLIPTFKGKDGTIVQGSAAKVNLPGKKDEVTESGNLMQTVSYRQTSISTNPGFDMSKDPTKTMRTTTINVPSNSTIAKPKRYESFTLGARRTGNQPQPTSADAGVGAGVTLGGGNPYASQSATTPTSLNVPDNQPQLSPTTGGFSSADLQRLSPRPASGVSAFPRATSLPPVSNPDWTRPGRSYFQ